MRGLEVTHNAQDAKLAHEDSLIDTVLDIGDIVEGGNEQNAHTEQEVAKVHQLTDSNRSNEEMGLGIVSDS